MHTKYIDKHSSEKTSWYKRFCKNYTVSSRRTDCKTKNIMTLYNEFRYKKKKKK